jgi:hypothetical protein
VKVHSNFNDNPYGNFNAVETALKNLGVRHIRDGLVDTAWTPHYDRLNELGRGIKATLITSPGQTAALLMAYPSRVADNFEAYEAPNEYDQSGDANWYATMNAFLGTMSGSVQRNPHAFLFPILGPSLTQAASYPKMTASATWPGKPVITTETGYCNDPTTTEGIPEDVAGRYLPRIFLEQWLGGIERTYIYELVDVGNTVASNGYGLMHTDFSPKPAYKAMKDLLVLLTDEGPAFKPGGLGMKLSGETANVQRLLLQKWNGRFYLAIWVELPSHDVNSKKALTMRARA